MWYGVPPARKCRLTGPVDMIRAVGILAAHDRTGIAHAA